MGDDVSQLKVSETHDITIIGGGPAGLFAAFYAGLRHASAKIIDSLPQLGGQLSELYPEKYIYDVAGFPKVLAKDLVDQLVQQAFQFHPTVCLNEQVMDVKRLEDGTFMLRTNRAEHHSRSVIITAGIGAFTPKSIPVPSIEKYEGNGVTYFIDDLKKYQGIHALVVGGGDSAVDFALMLAQVANSVTLIHRRDQFRAHEDNVKQLMRSSVDVKVFHELKAIHGESYVEGVTLLENRSKETMDLAVDMIIGSLGFSASLGPIHNWGLNIEDNQIIVNTKMETNIPGIYACGDIVAYPGKIKLIATGFGEAPTAVNNAKTYLDPKSKLQPMHSSSRKE